MESLCAQLPCPATSCTTCFRRITLVNMTDYNDSANSVGKRTRDLSPSTSPDKNLPNKATLEPVRDLLRDWGSNEELSSPGAASLPHSDGASLALSSASEEERQQQQEDDTQSWTVIGRGHRQQPPFKLGILEEHNSAYKPQAVPVPSPAAGGAPGPAKEATTAPPRGTTRPAPSTDRTAAGRPARAAAATNPSGGATRAAAAAGAPAIPMRPAPATAATAAATLLSCPAPNEVSVGPATGPQGP
ncbi:hypothetical protein E2C01_058093 [Portunus trituberculatus]|uniref:Uncharacterized protein n=1 Tax=Portunus trituberculatus TaxID=210409 RepID=A0A5B7H549_PORTR|nr:hypothetical protein [Portunus trituberculatus]